MKRGLSESCYVFFLTLANPTRLAILETLQDGPRSVTRIAKAVGQEQSMISHNLKPLIRCGFVFVERRWKERIYHLNEETLNPILDILDQHMRNYCRRTAEDHLVCDVMVTSGKVKERASPPLKNPLFERAQTHTDTPVSARRIPRG